MPLELHIEGLGEVIVARQLARFEADLKAPAHAMEAIADELRAYIEQQFDTEGGHASGGWKPLTEARVREKARLGLDPHILQATHRLKESLTRKFDPDAIERRSESSLVFGTTVPYGIFHQSSAPRTKIPFRPPIALTEEDKRRMAKGLQRALLASMPKQAWGGR